MKIIILFLFVIISVVTLSAQPIKLKPNVHVPDTVLSELCKYLEKREGTEIWKKAIYVNNLVDNYDKKFKNGVYRFRLNSPHACCNYIFIYEDGKIRIFDIKAISDLLKELIDYFKSIQLTQDKQIIYYKAILNTW